MNEVEAPHECILTEKYLAAWLGVSIPTVQRWRSSGSGPRFVQLSLRRIGYRRSDIETSACSSHDRTRWSAHPS